MTLPTLTSGIFGPENRPIVEFAIENQTILKKRIQDQAERKLNPKRPKKENENLSDSGLEDSQSDRFENENSGVVEEKEGRKGRREMKGGRENVVETKGGRNGKKRKGGGWGDGDVDGDGVEDNPGTRKQVRMAE